MVVTRQTKAGGAPARIHPPHDTLLLQPQHETVNRDLAALPQAGAGSPFRQGARSCIRQHLSQQAGQRMRALQSSCLQAAQDRVKGDRVHVWLFGLDPWRRHAEAFKKELRMIRRVTASQASASAHAELLLPAWQRDAASVPLPPVAARPRPQAGVKACDGTPFGSQRPCASSPTPRSPPASPRIAVMRRGHHRLKVGASARPGGRLWAKMDAKQLLAARAADLNAAAPADEQQLACRGTELALRQRRAQPVRPLDGERGARHRRIGFQRIFTRGVQARQGGLR